MRQSRASRRTLATIRQSQEFGRHVGQMASQGAVQDDIAVVIAAFNAAPPVRNASKVKGGKLSEAQEETLQKARHGLAVAMGYEVEEDDAEWITLTRHGVRIEMRQTPFPSAQGMSGNDRIVQMRVSVENDSRVLCEYDSDEHVLQPCVDSTVQCEIDRAVAIFG